MNTQPTPAQTEAESGTNNAQDNHAPRAHAPTALWVSAICLFALILAQGWFNSRPALPEANAGVVSAVGPLTILTAESNNEDLVLVLDNRAEELFVYRTDIRSGIQLHQRLTIPQVFAEARARSQGRN